MAIILRGPKREWSRWGSRTTPAKEAEAGADGGRATGRASDWCASLALAPRVMALCNLRAIGALGRQTALGALARSGPPAPPTAPITQRLTAPRRQGGRQHERLRLLRRSDVYSGPDGRPNYTAPRNNAHTSREAAGPLSEPLQGHVLCSADAHRVPRGFGITSSPKPKLEAFCKGPEPLRRPLHRGAARTPSRKLNPQRQCC